MRVYFAWFDMWCGLFWDRKKRILYACPVPCLVIEARNKWAQAVVLLAILCVLLGFIRRKR